LLKFLDLYYTISPCAATFAEQVGRKKYYNGDCILHLEQGCKKHFFAETKETLKHARAHTSSTNKINKSAKTFKPERF